MLWVCWHLWLGVCHLWYLYLSLSFSCFSKPITYSLTLEELGTEIVHKYQGREPSGRMFNEIVLDHNSECLWGLWWSVFLSGQTYVISDQPHNPMVNSGAIMSASILLHLVKPEMNMAQKYDYVYAFFKVPPAFEVDLFVMSFCSLCCRGWQVVNTLVSTIQSSYLKEIRLTGTLHWPTSWGKAIASLRPLLTSTSLTSWIFISRWDTPILTFFYPSNDLYHGLFRHALLKWLLRAKASSQLLWPMVVPVQLLGKRSWNRIQWKTCCPSCSPL